MIVALKPSKDPNNAKVVWIVSRWVLIAPFASSIEALTRSRVEKVLRSGPREVMVSTDDAVLAGEGMSCWTGLKTSSVSSSTMPSRRNRSGVLGGDMGLLEETRGLSSSATG